MFYDWRDSECVMSVLGTTNHLCNCIDTDFAIKLYCISSSLYVGRTRGGGLGSSVFTTAVGSDGALGGQPTKLSDSSWSYQVMVPDPPFRTAASAHITPYECVFVDVKPTTLQRSAATATDQFISVVSLTSF